MGAKMSVRPFKRKLTAILSADAKGYSRLMGKDELAVFQTLKSYKEIISNLIYRLHGRVVDVDSPGDNILAEFDSVVNAVQCALEIQEELKCRNADLLLDRKMEFRIESRLPA
jgi:adenylate cyclase